MFHYFCAVLFCAIFNLRTGYAVYPKCCGLDEILFKGEKEDNYTFYICGPNENKRNYVMSNVFNYCLFNYTEAFCVDHTDDFNITKFHCDTLETHPVDLPSYFKCCPPGFCYDHIHRKCSSDGDVGEILLAKNWHVQVGLPDCKTVITDRFYDNIPEGTSASSGTCADKICNSDGIRKSYVVRTCEPDFGVCRANSAEHFKCVRKCCPDGKSFVGGPFCKTTHLHGVRLENFTKIERPKDDFALIHGSKCKKYVGYENKYDFYLDEDGYFHIKLYRNPFYVSFAPDEEMYCLEHVEAKGLKGDYFFICFQANSTKFKFQVTRIGLILSCIFLLLTLFGYGFLPEMQNLFGKTLMCYCSALLLLFALLAHLQFNQNISNNRDICAAYGFLIMCSSLASFAWLNTMCFDIWWTFGAPKGSLSIQQRDRERKRFIWYNIYGWCVPILLTAITSALHYTKILPKSIHPEIGGSKCYFEKINNNYGYQIFFVLPITIIFVCNAILFIKTVVYCMKVKSEINKMNDTNAAKSAKKKGFIADKEKMMLLLKLFIVMGISWLFEAVSSMISFEDNTYLSIIEIVWDTINSLQGVFIFLIFICKRKILEAYKKKFGMKQRRQSITSGATHSTSLMSKQNSAKDTTKSI